MNPPLSNSDRLNFQAPRPPTFAEPLPETTDIICFVNNNQWPVHVSNNILGISLTLSNRGDTIKQPATGKLVNDPRFMCFVGAGQLSVQRGTEQKPVVVYREIIPQTPAGSGFPQGFAGNATAMPGVQAPTAQPAGPSQSVRAFSDRQSAINAGLIDGRIVELQEGVPDNDSAPPQNAPEIRVPNYKQIDPQKLKDFANQQAETPAQAPLVSSLVSAASADPDEDPIKKAIRDTVPSVATQAAPPPANDAPAAPVPAAQPLDLPQPKLDETEPSPAPAAKVKYVDPNTNEEFKYRSLLERHLKKKYGADAAATMMEKYPRT